MSESQDHVDIKFRLNDGSDIGPINFPSASNVATLKQSIISQWPKEKEDGPHTMKDITIISAGRILDNNTTVGGFRSPLCDITTMHVLVQPRLENEMKSETDPKQNKCVCVIL